MKRGRCCVRGRFSATPASAGAKTRALEIGGIRFHSRVLVHTWRNGSWSFPLVLTVGEELEKSGLTQGDLLRHILPGGDRHLTLSAAAESLKATFKACSA